MFQKHIWKLSLAVCFICGSLSGTAQNTLQHNLSAKQSRSVETLVTPDSITNNLFIPSGLTFRGFEKKQSDTKESFVVTNNTKFNISRFTVVISYTDADKLPVHQREVVVECDLPSGATRQVSIPSFDNQKKYYYIHGPRPRRSSVPFSVAMKLTRYDIIAR